jgi:hypothetical protein
LKLLAEKKQLKPLIDEALQKQHLQDASEERGPKKQAIEPPVGSSA